MGTSTCTVQYACNRTAAVGCRFSHSRTTWPETILTPRSYVGGWATMASTPSTSQTKRSGVTPRPRRMTPSTRRHPEISSRTGHSGARRGGAYHGPYSTWLVGKTILTPRIIYRSSRQEDPENYRLRAPVARLGLQWNRLWRVRGARPDRGRYLKQYGVKLSINENANFEQQNVRSKFSA